MYIHLSLSLYIYIYIYIYASRRPANREQPVIVAGNPPPGPSGGNPSFRFLCLLFPPPRAKCPCSVRPGMNPR